MAQRPQRVTSHDVAREAGVSQATVSRALRQDSHVRADLRARVEAAADRLGYVPSGPARNLARNRTNTVGVVIADITNPFYPHLLRALHQELTLAGYRVILLVDAVDAQGPSTVFGDLLDRSMDGLIITTGMVDSPLPQALADRGLPVVLAVRTVDGAALDAVTSDNVRGAADAARHLTELGHRRIAVILGPERTSTAREREAGFRAGLARAGVALPPELRRTGAYTHESGYANAQALLQADDPPTAIFCGNDTVALGAIEGAHALGLDVPGDVSLIGFDDIPMAGWSTVQLTTVRQPIADIGATAARRLLERLAAEGDPPPPRRDVFPTELVRRRTTAPPRS